MDVAWRRVSAKSLFLSSKDRESQTWEDCSKVVSEYGAAGKQAKRPMWDHADRPFAASWSALSFPGIPVWAGTWPTVTRKRVDAASQYNWSCSTRKW